MIAELARGEVHVWISHPRAVRDPRLLERYEELLDRDEARRMRRFHKDADRHVFLVAHALLRVTLSRYNTRPSEDWRFVSDDRGAPEIDGDAAGLRFSLAHTADAVACAVTVDAPIGLDVESGPLAFDPVELFGLLAPDETSELSRSPADLRESAFLECWTLKEAYLKARGLGLSDGLDRVWFRPFERPPTVRFADGWDDDPERWSFVSSRLSHGDYFALAVGVPRNDGITLYARETVPLAAPLRRTDVTVGTRC